MIMGKFKIVGQKFGVVCDLNVGVRHFFFFFLGDKYGRCVFKKKPCVCFNLILIYLFINE